MLLTMRPSLRVEIEEAFFESVVSEIFREFVSAIADAQRELEINNKDLDVDEEPEVVGFDDLKEIAEEVLDSGRRGFGFPIGLADFVDALDRAGWDLRRRRLTSSKKSVKTRKPRIRRLLGEA